LLAAMLTFLVNYLVSANIVANIPAWFYWSLIFLGLVIKNFAIQKICSWSAHCCCYSFIRCGSINLFHWNFCGAFICNCIHIAIM